MKKVTKFIARFLVLISVGVLIIPFLSDALTSVHNVNADSTTDQKFTGKLDTSVDSQKRQQLYKKYFTVTESNDTTTYSITDANLDEYLSSLGINIESTNSSDSLQEKSASASSKSGVTKILIHGKKRNGTFTIYLSARTMNAIRDSSLTTAANIIEVLFPPMAGIGEAVSMTLAVVDRYHGFKRGRRFIFKHFKYKYWRYQ